MSKREKRLARINSSSEWISLSESQSKELLELAGYDYYSNENQLQKSMADLDHDDIEKEMELYKRGLQLLTNVRFCLSIYDDAVVSLDNAPTSKDKSDQFKKLRASVYDLYDQLIKLGPHGHAELEEKNYDTKALIKMLGAFLAPSYRIISENNKESRGRKKARARQAIINHIAVYFDRACITEEDVPEQTKFQFISLALEFANIPRPKNIKRLFHRPGEKQILFTQVQ